MTKPVNLADVRKARASLKKLAETYPELRAPSSKGNRAKWEELLEEEVMAGAKKTKVSEEQLVVRLSKSLMDRVDRYAEQIREEQPGPAWKRSDVVRLLLARALDEVEQTTPRKN